MKLENLIKVAKRFGAGIGIASILLTTPANSVDNVKKMMKDDKISNEKIARVKQILMEDEEGGNCEYIEWKKVDYCELSIDDEPYDEGGAYKKGYEGTYYFTLEKYREDNHFEFKFWVGINKRYGKEIPIKDGQVFGITDSFIDLDFDGRLDEIEFGPCGTRFHDIMQKGGPIKIENLKEKYKSELQKMYRDAINILIEDYKK